MHSPSSLLDRICVVVVWWQWPIRSRLQGNAFCMCACAHGSLLNNLLCFSLPSFVRSFSSSFLFSFFYYLRSNYHVWVCLCGCNSSNSSSSSTVLLLGTHSTTMTRKKLVHVRTRMNKREKEKREREWDQSIRQLMYYCIYITSTTMLKTRLLWEEKKKEMDKVWIAYGSSNITGMITFFSYCLFST
jgi:hypothetical protein